MSCWRDNGRSHSSVQKWGGLSTFTCAVSAVKISSKSERWSFLRGQWRAHSSWVLGFDIVSNKEKTDEMTENSVLQAAWPGVLHNAAFDCVTAPWPAMTFFKVSVSSCWLCSRHISVISVCMLSYDIFTTLNNAKKNTSHRFTMKDDYQLVFNITSVFFKTNIWKSFPPPFITQRLALSYLCLQ